MEVAGSSPVKVAPYDIWGSGSPLVRSQRLRFDSGCVPVKGSARILGTNDAEHRLQCKAEVPTRPHSSVVTERLSDTEKVRGSIPRAATAKVPFNSGNQRLTDSYV